MNRKTYFSAICFCIILALFSLAACKKQTPTTTAPATPSVTTSAAPTTAGTSTSAPTEATTATTTATTTTEATTSEATTTATNQPDLSWSTKTTERSFQADDGTAVLTVTCTLPNIADAGISPVGTAINQYFDQMAARAIGEAAEIAPEAIDAYNLMGSEFFSWSEELTGEVVWQSEKYVSTTTANDNYYGGAHPNFMLASACFRLADGKLMALSEFFTIPEDEVVDQLVGLIYEQTSTILDETGAYLLYDCTEEMIRGTFLPEHYYLTEEGLVLYFQPYDIAPYSVGLPQFLIPYARLKPVLRDLE